MKRQIKNLLLRLAAGIQRAFGGKKQPLELEGAARAIIDGHPNAAVGDPANPIVSDPVHDVLITPDKVPLSDAEAHRKMMELQRDLVGE